MVADDDAVEGAAMTEPRSRQSEVQRVTLQRHVEDDGAEVWIVSDEDGEFARAGHIADALHYASDLMHGPGTGPRGMVWNLMRAMEDTSEGVSSSANPNSPFGI